MGVRRRVAGMAKAVLGDRYDMIRARALGEQPPISHDARVQMLDSLDLFDHDFYSAQVGSTMGREEAARHFVERGKHEGFAVHPLLDTEYLPGAVRTAVEAGEIEVLIEHLESPASAQHAWGAVFDPRAGGFDGHLPAAQVAALTDDDPVPVSAEFFGPSPTWGVLRRVAVEQASRSARQRATRTLPLVTDLDKVIDESWLQRASARPAMPAGAQRRVSIVMPVRDREALVGRAIRSVLNQTHQNWELLVVDDGSTDGSVDVVEEFARTDPRVRSIRQSAAGVSTARNVGCQAAEGEFIAFLDSDNVWTPHFLAYSLFGHEEGAVRATYSSTVLRDEKGATKYRGGQVEHADLMVGNSIDLNVLMLERSLLEQVGGFDSSLRRWVDHDFVMRVSALARLVHVPFIGVEYDDARSGAARITTKESNHWQFMVLNKSLCDWDRADRELASRTPGRVSIIVRTHQDLHRTIRCVDWLLRSTADDEVEIVLIDNGSRRAVGRNVAQRYAAEERVKYARLAREYTFAMSSNVGLIESTGEFVLFLREDVEGGENWLQPLVARLNDGFSAVQPLLTQPNGTVQSAGVQFASFQGLPSSFLTDHPAQDALRHDGHGFAALSGAAMLWRAADVVGLRGFSAIYADGLEDVDLCLRAVAEREARFVVESRSVLVQQVTRAPNTSARDHENRRLFLNRWAGALPGPDASEQHRKIGLDVAHTIPDREDALGVARPLVIRPPREVSGTVPALRWAIKIGTGSAFVHDLAAALARAGQQVVIDQPGAFERATSYLDDVVLAVPGSHAIAPQAGRVNVLYITQGPDVLGGDDVNRSDLVFAASVSEADETAERFGRPVRVLSWATDPDGCAAVLVDSVEALLAERNSGSASAT